MTIYILDNDHKLNAQYLDDKSLNKMIKDIAQVLCNVHWKHQRATYRYQKYNIPLNVKENKTWNVWTGWTIQARANYLWLEDLGEQCLKESFYRHAKTQADGTRFIAPHKLEHIIRWARDNIPDLPRASEGYRRHNNENFITPLPLVMHKKYREYAETYDPTDNTREDLIIPAYRNYYQVKLTQTQCFKHDACIYTKQNKCLQTQPSWTNRQKPDWLNI